MTKRKRMDVVSEIDTDIDRMLSDPGIQMRAKYHDAGACWSLIERMRDRLLGSHQIREQQSLIIDDLKTELAGRKRDSMGTFVGRNGQRMPVIQCVISIGGQVDEEFRLINDGTGGADVGHYDVMRLQDGVYSGEFRIEEWKRGAGIPALVTFAMDAAVLRSRSSRGTLDVITGKMIDNVPAVEAWKAARIVPKFRTVERSAPAQLAAPSCDPGSEASA